MRNISHALRVLGCPTSPPISLQKVPYGVERTSFEVPVVVFPFPPSDAYFEADRGVAVPYCHFPVQVVLKLP